MKLRFEFATAFSAGLAVLRFRNLPGESACYQLGDWREADDIVEGM